MRSSVCNSDRGFRFQVELRISSTFSRPIGRCDEHMAALIWLTERFVPGREWELPHPLALAVLVLSSGEISLQESCSCCGVSLIKVM